MSDQSDKSAETATVALQLVVGLLALIKTKRLFEPHEFEWIFEGALAGAESSSPNELSDRVRQRLEKLANQIASLPEIQTGPSTPDPNTHR